MYKNYYYFLLIENQGNFTNWWIQQFKTPLIFNSTKQMRL